MNLCLVSLVKCTNAPMCHYRVCASYCKPRLLRIPSAPGPSQLLGQLATINPRNPNLERCQKESSPFPGSNGRLWIVPQLPGPVCGGWGVGVQITCGLGMRVWASKEEGRDEKRADELPCGDGSQRTRPAWRQGASGKGSALRLCPTERRRYRLICPMSPSTFPFGERAPVKLYWIIQDIR